ncbi:MAG: hypothetical protein AB8G17_20680 [Gammaproteobacteria bacterium]
MLTTLIFIAPSVETAQAPNTALPIGDPGEALTPRDIVPILFELSGLTPKCRSVSPAMFRVAAGVITPSSAGSFRRYAPTPNWHASVMTTHPNQC